MKMVLNTTALWTQEDVVYFFDNLAEIKWVLYYCLGGIFALVALAVVAIFFIALKS
jgi:hypothetical protein